MEIAVHSSATLSAIRNFKLAPLLALGVLISASLILNGLLFRTYAVTMASPQWEAARQYGLPFIVAEMAVIFCALRRGLDVSELWSKLPVMMRGCILVFTATFWLGGAFYSEYAQRATTQNLIFLIHPLFACAVYHIVHGTKPSEMRAFVFAIGIGLVIFSGMTAMAFLNHPPLATMPNNEIIWQFIIPGFVSVRLFGAFCGAIFCLLFAQLLLDEETGHKRVLPYVWLTLCGAMTIWSGTRNGVLGIAIVTIILFVVYRLRPRNLKTVASLFLSSAIAAWLAVSLIPYNDPAFMLIAAQDTATTESISGGRASYWQALWHAYQSVPWFGAGPYASYWIVPDGAQRHVQPHNILLQFLLTWGVLATFAALSVLTYLTVKAHRVALKHRHILAFLAMLDCLLIMSFFDGIVHFAQTLMLIMISFGAIFSATKT